MCQLTGNIPDGIFISCYSPTWMSINEWYVHCTGHLLQDKHLLPDIIIQPSCTREACLSLVSLSACQSCKSFWIRNWSHIISLLIVLLFLLGDLFEKSPRLCRFESDWNETWQDSSSTKYALIYIISRRKVPPSGECTHTQCSSICQCLIYCTFVPVP